MPVLKNPLGFTDFLMESYNVGGSIRYVKLKFYFLNNPELIQGMAMSFRVTFQKRNRIRRLDNTISKLSNDWPFFLY